MEGSTSAFPTSSKGMNKSREAEALRRVPLFASLPEEQLQLLANVVVRKPFPKHAIVLAEGEKTDSLYVILSGSVKVGMTDDEGKEVILSFLGPGEFFGEMALIDQHPRSANIVTREPCEVMIVAKDDFRKCLAKNSDLAMQIMVGLVKRLRDADKKIESLALVNVYGRVAQVLLELAENKDGVLVIGRRLTRQDIARMVGASREMVSRVMRDLVAGDYIRIEPRKIVLYPKLVAYAGEIGRTRGVK